MKHILILGIILALTSCKCYEKLNYSKLENEQLEQKRNELQLSLNYIIVNSVISDIENGRNHIILTKINKSISDKYLKSDIRLQEEIESWKYHSSIISEFESTHKPELKELGKLLRTKKISKTEYFKKNRKLRTQLKNTFPDIYSNLSNNHINSLKTMWRKAGRLMIEDFKKEEKEFPTNWIPEEDFKKAKTLKEYNCVKNTIQRIDKENGI